MKNDKYPFVNLPLPYSYGALEPYIDEKTMRLHHQRHLQTYINNLNAALKNDPRLQKLSLEQLIGVSGGMNNDLGRMVHNNAGGVYNHRFFFEGLTNHALSGSPSGELADALIGTFGSYSGFINEFTQAALSVFGSGYAWLVNDFRGLKIITTANQDTPIENGFCPVLTVDVWEHAYYLKHFNKRADYISDWFRVLNWKKANENYLNCARRR